MGMCGLLNGMWIGSCIKVDVGATAAQRLGSPVSRRQHSAKRLWQQVSSIQHSVCHSCQSPDRDLSTLSSPVRQTDLGTHTHTHIIARPYLHEHIHIHIDVNNTMSRLVRAEDNWLAGWQESDCLGYELVSPPHTLSLSRPLSFAPLSLHPSHLCQGFDCFPESVLLPTFIPSHLERSCLLCVKWKLRIAVLNGLTL